MLLHYLGKQETEKLRLPLMMHAFLFLAYQKQNSLKYHLVRAVPPFTVKMIDWMHHTGPIEGA